MSSMGDQEETSHHRFLLLEEHRSSQAPGTIPGSSPSDRSVSADGKPTTNRLRITFKYSKGNSNDDLSEDDRLHDQSSRKVIRVCKVCSKGFGSGRALAGHMRVHLQDKNHLLPTQNQNPNLLNIHHPKLNKDVNRFSSVPASLEHPGHNNAAQGNQKTSSDISCSLCRKMFPSMKSLYGHMRCHPERGWKGIHPPPPAPRNSSSSTVSDSIAHKVDDQIDSNWTETSSALDLTHSLQAWTVTAKRGRKSIATASSDEKLPEAFYELVKAACADSADLAFSNNPRCDESGTKKPKIEDGYSVSGYLDSLEKQGSEGPQVRERELLLHTKPTGCSLARRNDDKAAASIHVLSKRPKGSTGTGFSRAEFPPHPVKSTGGGSSSPPVRDDMDTDGFGDVVVHNRNSDEESDSRNNDCSMTATIRQLICNIPDLHTKKMKMKKKKKLRDLEAVGDLCMMDHKQTPVTSDRYRCATCFKCFPSHQALGGHRSSHKKGKSTAEESAFAEASVEEGVRGYAINKTPVEEEATEHDDGDGGSRVVGGHRCGTCSKIFPTGQALGGHMRCHWTGPSSSVASPEEGSKIFPTGQAIGGNMRYHLTGPSSSEGSKVQGRVMLDFDLNEVPAMEDGALLSPRAHSPAVD